MPNRLSLSSSENPNPPIAYELLDEVHDRQKRDTVGVQLHGEGEPQVTKVKMFIIKPPKLSNLHFKF